MKFDDCADCGFEMPREFNECPHCGRPGRFPNVLDADDPDEVRALDSRYDDAARSADRRGILAQFKDFESKAASGQAVMVCRLEKLLPLAMGDRDLYSTYHDLRKLRFSRPSSVPDDPEWDVVRPMTEIALFGNQNREHIHYAALSLTDRGLTGSAYGECHVLLREDMIAHRTSAFEENSPVFMKRHGITVWEAGNLPKGYRSNWERRARLAVAKSVGEIAASTLTDDFPSILLRVGAKPVEDVFIELHIFGPMTIRTFLKVTVVRTNRRPGRGKLKPLEDLFAPAGVTLKSVEE